MAGVLRVACLHAIRPGRARRRASLQSFCRRRRRIDRCNRVRPCTRRDPQFEQASHPTTRSATHSTRRPADRRPKPRSTPPRRLHPRSRPPPPRPHPRSRPPRRPRRPRPRRRPPHPPRPRPAPHPRRRSHPTPRPRPARRRRHRAPNPDRETRRRTGTTIRVEMWFGRRDALGRGVHRRCRRPR